MKKIFLALAAVAALAACTKSEAEYEPTGEIAFTPVTKNITKTMMTGQTFQASEEFNVWAYYKPVPAGTDMGTWLSNASTPQTYLNEKTFAYTGADHKWGGKESAYFWPKNGSLVFVGYYPTDIAENAHHDLATNTMSFYDINQSRVASRGFSEDMMYFNMTPSCASGSVVATFKHALSWISVILVKDETNANTDKATITVEKVEFTNVLPTGDATVVGGKNISWGAKGAAATVDILEGTPVVLVADNEDQEPYEPLFIPQKMTGNLVITYTITSEDGSYFREVKTIALGGMKDSDNKALTSWEAAKHYTYTITIGTSEILVDPKVAPWEDVEVNTTI